MEHVLHARWSLGSQVVEDHVRRREASRRWTVAEGASVEVSWEGPDTVRVTDADGVVHRMGPGARWRCAEKGALLELALVPRRRLPPSIADGDLPIFLAVGVATLLAMVVGGVVAGMGGGGGPMAPAPTPELIARLLKGEFEGQKEGAYAPPPDPVVGGGVEVRFNLPAGGAGPLTQPGGAAEVGAEQKGSVKERSSFQPLDAQAPGAEGAGAAKKPVASNEKRRKGKDDQGDAPDSKDAASTRAEKEGFGLEDWEKAKVRDDLKLKTEISMVRAMLEIDPDDAWAISQLAYYQYLALDTAGSEASYKRLIELYPEDSAAYNNVALVYKRRGEYALEETWYRQALTLEPDDPVPVVNLALCLAHQGRYAEALAAMDEISGLPEGTDAYADLHRAKIHALMGQRDESLRWLSESLTTLPDLDTFHQIEFRQDIRLDPAFDGMREDPEFRRILEDRFGAQGLWMAEGARAKPSPSEAP